MQSAKVICDSIGPNGKRIISVEARYWRMIHSELMTHRAFARNSASSRAIPFYKIGKDGELVKNCMYNMISTDPFIPEFIGMEQKGMQSGDELEGEDRKTVLECIMKMRNFCLTQTKIMYDHNCHKSIINRYIEPWMYITVLITATEWKNFFRLRVHPKAEKHFNQLAGLIKTAIDNSIPQKLEAGQWHLPYINDFDLYQYGKLAANGVLINNEESQLLKQISAGRCARLSYLTHDGIRDHSEDIRLFNTLVHPKIEQDRDDDVIHASPLEHVNQATDGFERSGPFIGWKQFRKEFPNENVDG